MADHLRKQIREAAAAQLTGLATTGTRVFQSRTRAVQASDLPCLRVFCDDEKVVTKTMGPDRDRARYLDLVVEGVCAANVDYDDTADQICKEVENALDANNSLGGLVKFIEPSEINTEFAGEGETQLAAIRMKFQVLYYTRMRAPDVPL